jgi:hypothetical protein
MGTRGSITIKYQGKRYTVWNHYDSYPSSLGQALVNIILKNIDITLEELLGQIAEITDTDVPVEIDTETWTDYTWKYIINLDKKMFVIRIPDYNGYTGICYFRTVDKVSFSEIHTLDMFELDDHEDD